MGQVSEQEPSRRLLSDRWRRAMVIAVLAAVTTFVLAYLLLVPNFEGGNTLNDTDPMDEWPLVIGAYLSVILGAFLAFVRPRNPLGFLLMLEFGFVVYSPTVVLVDWATSRFGEHFLVSLLAWTGNWTWLLAFVGIIFATLLFPDGRYLTARWAWVGRAAIIVLGLLFGITMVGPGPLEAAPSLDNPFGVPALEGAEGLVGFLMILVMGLALWAVVSLILRYRRSSGTEKAQLKWIAVGFAAGLVFAIGAPNLPLSRYLDGLSSLIPTLAIVVAILKFRLYDIDVVISKSLVFGVLAVFITGVYVGIVVGLGQLLGGGDEPSLFLSIVATGLVAVLFEPVRVRAQGWANRVVFGRRASPYQVLSGLTARLGETSSDADVLTRLARSLGEGTGSQAVVWLRIGDGFEPVATSSESDPPRSYEETDLRVEVTHEDETLGMLTLNAARGQQITPADERLLEDVAGNVGLMLRNARLNAELVARARDLVESRRRLVAVQDHERRRLERDLHDGAQQHVVAAAMQLNMARMIAHKEGHESVATELEYLVELDQQAVDQLRTIARGIYPPLLDSEGLKAAVTGAVQHLPINIDVKSDDLPRYSEETEATVYFCVTEALRDAVRRGANTATVTLTDEDGLIKVEVASDGSGETPSQTLQSLTDRTRATDGHLTETQHGIRFTLPAPARQETVV